MPVVVVRDRACGELQSTDLLMAYTETSSTTGSCDDDPISRNNRLKKVTETDGLRLCSIRALRSPRPSRTKGAPAVGGAPAPGAAVGTERKGGENLPAPRRPSEAAFAGRRAMASVECTHSPTNSHPPRLCATASKRRLQWLEI
ncbi:hypothetical protein Mapa_008790 [Marchantia paleacea]|nr:hypothetical protein Mapa_008790 [Marchantia paleacea]